MAAFQYRTRNFRDIGGVRGSRGLVRTGMLFRSAKLDDMNATEVDMLRPLGLTQALDLRDDGEKAEPDRLVDAYFPGLSLRAVPLMDNMPPEAIAALREKVKHIHSRGALRKLMAMQYYGIMTKGRPRVMEALKFVLSHEGPQVFFCVAGKDRTGIMGMVLGLILGLPPRAVLRDYLLTNDYYFGLPFWRKPTARARAQYAGSPMPLWMIDTLSEAHRVFLGAAFKPVQDAGGIDAWLCGEGGLDPALLKDFRTRMLVP